MCHRRRLGPHPSRFPRAVRKEEIYVVIIIIVVAVDSEVLFVRGLLG